MGSRRPVSRSSRRRSTRRRRPALGLLLRRRRSRGKLCMVLLLLLRRQRCQLLLRQCSDSRSHLSQTSRCLPELLLLLSLLL